MGLDFYAAADRTRGQPLFSLPERRLSALGPALATFEARTGVCVDPYGRTHLAATQLRLLATLVEPAGDLELARFLEATAAAGKGLVVEGD